MPRMAAPREQKFRDAPNTIDHQLTNLFRSITRLCLPTHTRFIANFIGVLRTATSTVDRKPQRAHVRFWHKADVDDPLCYLVDVPGALFWFAPLQRNRTRSPGRKVGASAVLGLKSAHVRFWHKADISFCAAHFRFRG